MLKFSNSIICSLCSLLSFQSPNSYSNMCLCNHGNIISPITNCQWNLSSESSHKINYFLFLFWGYSTGQYCISFECNLEESFLEIMYNDDQGYSRHYQGYRFIRMFIEIDNYFTNLFFHLSFKFTINNESLHLIS